MNPASHCRCAAVSALLKKNAENASRNLAGMSTTTATMTAATTPVTSTLAPPNAGLIIIGDEILRGQTRDTNSHFMTKRLHALGVRVSRISVIPDQLDIIAEEVKKFSGSYDHVVTSGGIGPTHDDLTFEGIALAFGHEVAPHPDLVSIISRWAKTEDLSAPHFKMARVSKEAQLKFGVDPQTGVKTNFPIVCVQNVYAFPGIPHLVERAFPLLERDLFCSSSSANPTFHTREIYLDARETDIAKVLDAFHAEFSAKGVNLGSYPEWTHSYYKVKLCLEATSEPTLISAHSSLISSLSSILPPRGILHKYDPQPTTDMGGKLEVFANAQIASNIDSNDQRNNQVQAQTDPNERDQAALRSSEDFGAKLKQARDVLEECLQRYEPEQICLAFNGGKDCTALLHLYAATLSLVMARRNINKENDDDDDDVKSTDGKMKDSQRQEKKDGKVGFKAIYIRKGNPFPEVEKFVEDMAKEFHLEIFTVSGSIKDGLKKIKDEHPELKAAIMGTRRTDPYSSHLTSFTPCDPDWPPFMRVNPILDWSYGDVWHFLRSLSLPYCELYDRGYTSLGAADNTFPCPKLEYVDEFGRTAFHPAYKLTLENEERDGRLV